MRYVKRGNAPFPKSRILISGLSQTGKTHSLFTFMYGLYDYFDPDEHADAVSYAGDKSMAILVCPGETGSKTLPPDTEHVTSYIPESVDGDVVTSARWSQEAIRVFDATYKEIVDNKPDILVIDGATSLAEHLMNRITSGDFLAGNDLSISTATGNIDPYRAARFYSQSHNTFGQYLAAWYVSNIPMIVVTCWEAWKGTTSDGGKPGGIQARRYLWPDMPGEMATRIVGRFDARISARLEERCYHKNCVDSQENTLHHVWQFLPKNDVAGVGIKGLKVTPAMKSAPWIHQNYNSLAGFISTFAAEKVTPTVEE